MSVAMIDNMIKAVISISMLKTMTKSMIDSMIGIVGSKLVMRLIIKAVLDMSIVSECMGIIVVWRTKFMSDLMGPAGLIMHVMSDFGEIV